MPALIEPCVTCNISRPYHMRRKPNALKSGHTIYMLFDIGKFAVNNWSTYLKLHQNLCILVNKLTDYYPVSRESIVVLIAMKNINL